MSFWAKDPELFLHKSRDGVVHLRRCKKDTTSTSSMLMRPEDLKDEGVVTDHLSLYGGFYDWEKNKYQALIDYIHPKRLMVNCRGSLIVEFATDDKAAPVVYIRALDILAMGSYGPPDLTVPARTVRYLQDGKVVPTDSNSKEETKDEAKLKEDLAKKTKEAAALQQDLTKEENKNKALVKIETKLKEDLAKKTKEAAAIQQDLTKEENKNKALVTLETKLKEDLAKKTKEAAAIQQDLTKQEDKNKALVKRVKELEEANKNCGDTATVRIYTAADTGYSLTIRDGHVILGPNDGYDVYQYWVKDEKYGASVQDISGLPTYALVNKFTGQALKPPTAAMEDVRLVPYNPDILDRSILWSEHEQGDGYRAIRSATHTSLNMDAHGGVRDGTAIKVWNWLAGDTQRWNIVSSSMA